MSDSQKKTDEERVLELLLGGRAPPGDGPGGPCPPVEVLAGLAERRLLDEERRSVERHVLGCEDCRSLVATLVDEGAASAAGRLVRLPGLWRALAAAAILLSVTAMGITLWNRNRDTDERLLAVAAELGRERPELFSGFRPLSRAERLNDPRERVRAGGGLVLRAPVGKVRDAASRFDWTMVPGVTGYELALFDDKSRLWKGSVAAPPFTLPQGGPALRPGIVHLWKVTAQGPTGDLEAKAPFEIATPEEVRSLDAAFREIEARAPRRLRRLLEAQLALRLGFLEDAERSARAYVEGWPEDVVGRETLFQAQARLGRPDADQAREAPR